MNSGPGRKESLSADQLEGILTQIREELGRVLIVFTGGEPLLLGEVLLGAIRRCRQLGLIPRVVTNAYWASSAGAARAMVRDLAEAGLDDLNISADDWHLPWISIQRVRWAYEAALELGFGNVVISTCFGPESVLTPQAINADFAAGAMELRYDEDDQTMRLNSDMVGNARAGIISNPHVQRIGRGGSALASEEVYVEEGDVGDLAGGCAWAVRAPAITPRGHLVSCCGFELEDNPILDYGDLNEQPLATLLDRADGDIVTNMIALIGPPKIKRVLEEICPDEIDFPQPSYGTYCDVCHDLVTRPANRRALYEHQGVFVDYVMKARARLRPDEGAAS